MATHQELHTIRDFIRFATTRFQEAGLYYGHGTDNAWDDAVALVLQTLHIPNEMGRDVADANLTKKEKENLLALIDYRVNERVPVAYLTNEAWFCGMPFYVDERVLIPRSPIAELIENQFSDFLEPDNVNRILDLCTGSGCIAIACADKFPWAQVDASDISEEALAVADANVVNHHKEQQVTLYQSDLFEKLPNEKYNLIVSNPPYVDQSDMDNLPEEFHHEPELGLAAGEDGLIAVEKILQQAKNYLTDDGVLIVEVGNSEYALREKHPELPLTWIEFENGGGGVFMLSAKDLS